MSAEEKKEAEEEEDASLGRWHANNSQYRRLNG